MFPKTSFKPFQAISEAYRTFSKTNVTYLMNSC